MLGKNVAKLYSSRSTFNFNCGGLIKMTELKKCRGLKKFIVLSENELNSLNLSQKHELNSICWAIRLFRKITGIKETPDYIVVDTNEPYANEVIDVLKKNGVWGEQQTLNSVTAETIII
jgi:hypothetical protein